MTVLSIDPAFAKEMAYALFEEGQLLYYDKVRELEDIRIRSLDVVVTEDPFPGGAIGKYAYKGRVTSFKGLCYAVGMIIQFAKTTGADYKLVRPVDWKSHWSLTKKTPANLQQTIRIQLTRVVGDEDVQDAILIGKYYVEHVQVIKGA